MPEQLKTTLDQNSYTADLAMMGNALPIVPVSTETLAHSFNSDDVIKTGEYALVGNAVLHEATELPQLTWEVLENGQNKMAYIITDLSPDVFSTYSYTPSENDIRNNPNKDLTMTESGKKIFEVGIDPNVLEDQKAGIYRLRLGPSEEMDIEIVKEGENTFFNIVHHDTSANNYADVTEYSALADPRPEEMHDPFEAVLQGYYGAILGATEGLVVSNLSPTIRAMYEKIGFKAHVVGDETRLLPPGPKTMQRFSKAKNLPLQFIGKVDNKAQIPVDPFEKAFADAVAPIGISELVYMLHDLQDDHLPAELLGENLDGTEREDPDEDTVLNMISPLAIKLIKDKNHKGTEIIDQLTPIVRGVIVEVDNSIGHKPSALTVRMAAASELYEGLGREVGVNVEGSKFREMLYAQAAKNIRTLRGGDPGVAEKAQELVSLARLESDQRAYNSAYEAVPPRLSRG